MITTLIFDIGGVIDITDMQGLALYLEKTHTIDGELFLKAWDEKIKNLDLGEINAKEFAAYLSKRTGKKLTLADVFEIRFEKFTHIDFKIIDIIRELKKKYTVAAISNNNELTINNIYAKTDLPDILDHIFLSYQLGLIKPDRRIFELALEKMGKTPEECIFIDDLQENIDVAKQLGMRTFRYKFQHREEFLKELDKLGHS